MLHQYDMVKCCRTSFVRKDLIGRSYKEPDSRWPHMSKPWPGVFSILPLSSIDQAQRLVEKSAAVADILFIDNKRLINDHLTEAFWLLHGKPVMYFKSQSTLIPHIHFCSRNRFRS